VAYERVKHTYIVAALVEDQTTHLPNTNKCYHLSQLTSLKKHLSVSLIYITYRCQIWAWTL